MRKLVIDKRQIWIEVACQTSGMDKLKATGASMNNFTSRIIDVSMNNKKLRITTKRVNEVLVESGAWYTRVSMAQVAYAATQQRQIYWANKLSMKNHQLGLALRRTGFFIGEDNKLYDDNRQEVTNLTNAQSRLIASTKKFRMELLSVMFFGMAVGRMFAAMTKGATEASGANDVWGVITMLVGLPAAMVMTDALLGLMGVYDSMPGFVQTAISWTAYLGQALGNGLMAVGMFGLGFEGLTQLFPKWGRAVEVAGGLMPWLSAKLAPVGLAFKAAAVWVWGYAVALWNAAAAGWAAIAPFAPIIAIVILAAAGIALMIKNWDGMIKGFQIWGRSLLTPIKYFNMLLDAIREMGGLLEAIKVFFSPIAELFGAKKYVPKGPKITAMQAGGIVTRPTAALLGERGPEAVIPLRGGGLGGTVFSPTININNPVVRSEADIRNIGRQISDILYIELRRLGIR